MAFLEKTVVLGLTDTELYVCPATLSGSAHGLTFSNITGVAKAITLKLFSQATGLTTQVTSSGQVIPANGQFTWPKPINMVAGDKIIALADTVSSVVAVIAVYLDQGAMPSSAFVPRGTWSDIANYAVNDVAAKDGTSYLAVAPSLNSSPPSINWMVLSSKGDDGGVASVNGMTGDVTGIATTGNITNERTAIATLSNKTISGAANTLTADGINAVGFHTIPQVSRSAAYTLVLTDSGKHILHPSADTTARIFTIPSNASVAYPIGTALTFVNQASAGVVTIAISTDVMRLAGAGTTGSRTLAANGIATAIKLTATEWIISGSGLT